MKQIVALLIVLCLVPFTAVAQDFCEGNFNYDYDVDGSDAFTFKTDFGRSLIKNPCPPDGPAPVPRTGQTISHSGGDDGYYQKGVEWPNPRFTDNADGTVTDNLTGLIWLQDATCFESTFFDQAVNDCNWLNDSECGLSDGSSPGDWRLPNINEMTSLIDRSNFPAIPSAHPFSIVSTLYWSSTTYADDSSSGWLVDLYTGEVEIAAKVSINTPWPVRGGH